MSVNPSRVCIRVLAAAAIILFLSVSAMQADNGIDLEIRVTQTPQQPGGMTYRLTATHGSPDNMTDFAFTRDQEIKGGRATLADLKPGKGYTLTAQQINPNPRQGEPVLKPMYFRAGTVASYRLSDPFELRLVDQLPKGREFDFIDEITVYISESPEITLAIDASHHH